MTESAGRRSRASLLAWAPGEETREFAAARRVEDELGVELTARLVAESTAAGVTHLVLVLVVTALAWEAVPLEVLLPWAGIVAAAGASRAVVARRMSAIGSSPEFTTRAIRMAVWATGLGWASATVIIAPAAVPSARGWSSGNTLLPAIVDITGVRVSSANSFSSSHASA